MNTNELAILYRITKDLVDGDGPVRDVNGRLLIHEDEQLKWWKEHFLTILNHITSGKLKLGESRIDIKLKLATDCLVTATGAGDGSVTTEGAGAGVINNNNNR